MIRIAGEESGRAQVRRSMLGGLAILLLWLASCASPPSLQERLGRAVEAALGAPALRGARVGFVVRDGDRVLFAKNPDMGFMTASNMKLFSSAAALEVLGPEFRFETRLIAIGELRDKVLLGDLVLVGSGDPTLGAYAFEKGGAKALFARMGRALRASGIERVHGRVLGDDSFQEEEGMGLGWDWSYLADWYAAPFSGLCLNENCLDLLISGTEAGKAPALQILPSSQYMQVENRVRCVAKGSKEAKTAEVVYHRALGSRSLVMTGSFPSDRRGKRDWCSVDNPTAFAASVLAETLDEMGIEIEGRSADLDEVGALAKGPAQEIYVHRSPPMSAILRRLNKKSQNLYAEQVLRRAAKERFGKADMASARKLVLRMLEGFGADGFGFFMADGSGLSRLNCVSPRQLAAWLSGMAGSEHFALYLKSLPIAGIDGTLRRRFPEGSTAHGLVRAKTGYISRVVGLSGYVPRKGREALVFSLLVNDFHGSARSVQALIDRWIELLAESELASGPRPRENSGLETPVATRGAAARHP